VNDYQLASR